MARRDAVRIATRVTTGIAGVAVLGVVVTGALLLPPASTEASAPSVLVTPVATDQQRVCPGALLRPPEADAAATTGAVAVGSSTVTSGSATAGAATGGPGVRTSRLQAPEVQGGASTEASVLAVAGAEGDDPTELAGAASQIATQSDLAGLAAAPCSEATAESWLVGGGTTTGRTTFVVLDNPSGVSSTVDLAISGEDGAVSAPGASGINVPAGSRRVLSLAGLAPDLSSPAIHVQSRGGQVVATLEQSTVRGLLAGGVDVIVPAAAPATTLTMTGLRVDTQAAAQPAPAEGEAPAEGTDGAAGSGPGADVGTDPDRSTAVRILVPGSDDADVSVSVAPEDGTDGTGTTFTVEADGGRVTDFPVSGLTDGRYAVTVQSSVPVAAAVRTVSGAAEGGATDFAWLPASGALTRDALVSVPAGPAPLLHVRNPGDAEATVTARPTDGSEPVALTVPAGAEVSASVAAGRTYLLEGSAGLTATVTLAEPGRSAALPVVPVLPAADPLRVHP
ncbi:hypothetical protein FGG90_00975 [Clavibacter tessellarius]|uniref:Secreted protein n=1 Tax=Clavibacter tessellarius TaxID=31965 RepID=A0A225CCX2_9MICO|nr:DUF5719 family protein [Clavibacter michiganensis]OQJ61615.1 hypothetical protein B5P24_00435 [Clavibacter michiganensis subsp. tessellarius]UKF32686.1 hypothetical protein FGG90_00975 [Clavibacter michiganensis subsp. tessellarius]